MLTRRSFIQRSSVFAAACFIDSGHWLKLHKDLGIQLYTIRDEVAKNLDNSIAQIAKAGYSQVELYGYDYKTRQFFGRSVTQMAALLKKNKLQSPSGHYGIADLLYEPNYNWDSWKFLLEDAQRLGNKYVVIPYIDEQHRTADDFKRITERLNKGGELSKAAGITTGYHNHNFEFDPMGNTTPYEYMLSNTDPQLVKFEMDIYWVEYAGQKTTDWFKKHPGRFPLWHIKDMEVSTNGQPKGQTCEVGKGVINWKTIFAHRLEAGAEYTFVEQEQYRRPVFDCIKTSADYMKKNLLK